MSASAAFLLSLAVIAAPDAPGLHVELGAALVCDLNTTLTPALKEQGVSVTSATAPGWRLTVQQEGDALQLRLMTSNAELISSRRLTPVAADCPALARAIAVLVKSWLATRLATAPPPPTDAGVAVAPSHPSLTVPEVAVINSR